MPLQLLHSQLLTIFIVIKIVLCHGLKSTAHVLFVDTLLMDNNNQKTTMIPLDHHPTTTVPHHQVLDYQPNNNNLAVQELGALFYQVSRTY